MQGVTQTAGLDEKRLKTHLQKQVRIRVVVSGHGRVKSQLAGSESISL